MTLLDLQYNDLGNKTGAELAEAFAAIPSHVASVDITGNGLERIGTVEEVGALLLATSKNFPFFSIPGRSFQRNLIAYMNHVNQQVKSEVYTSDKESTILLLLSVNIRNARNQPFRVSSMHQPLSSHLIH